MASCSQTGTTLLDNGLTEKDHDKEGQEDEIAPPDDRISQQVNAVAAAREELTLQGTRRATGGN